MKEAIETLIRKYKIRWKQAPELFEIIIHQLTPPYINADAIKKDWLKWDELVASNKPITEITIIRGGKPYKFNKDKRILQDVQAWIDEPKKCLTGDLTKEELNELTEQEFEHVIEKVRGFFHNLKHLRPRQRYLLIYDLFQLAGYPFTSQQQKATNQNKAALISNWLKRSKPNRL